MKSTLSNKILKSWLLNYNILSPKLRLKLLIIELFVANQQIMNLVRYATYLINRRYLAEGN